MWETLSANNQGLPSPSGNRFRVLERRKIYCSFTLGIMFNNVGRFDQIVRLLLAQVLLYAGLSVYQDTGLVVGLDIAAALLAFSAAIGFCGIYRLLNINTRPPHDHPPV